MDLSNPRIRLGTITEGGVEYSAPQHHPHAQFTVIFVKDKEGVFKACEIPVGGFCEDRRNL